ncbi:MAG: ABC transporter ATP-binding protein [Chloroflexi bacterium]|nr:ABC transporter ATP-binding protein [Chloroflexota bacterium]MBU1751968.1 ABC transporter ATP-binding protein [Chloroflexota bacterium]MBU1877698.1 ABC transporter ATP-binding protein [Chloroflexota bacterium]
MSDAIIQTENLTRVFRPLLRGTDVVAVDGLNLAVGRGEVFGLVGPDGAGKTTTLRLLAAIMKPTEGAASVAGYDTMRDPESIKERIGYMAQAFSLYRDLSVTENLDFFADVFGLSGPERKERIDRLLRFSRLEPFRQRRAAHLSGGMQKKLALACTLLHQPEIVFLDEPTTGVDPVSRREFWDILLELHLQGVTIVVSTPYMDEAERCTRVGLMYEGRLMVCDTPENIKNMVEGQLVELRPADVRAAEPVVQAVPGVLEVQTYGELLHAFVDDAALTMPRLVAALERAGIAVSDARETRPRMEEAFISLVRRIEADKGETILEVESA